MTILRMALLLLQILVTNAMVESRSMETFNLYNAKSVHTVIDNFMSVNAKALLCSKKPSSKHVMIDRFRIRLRS